MEFGETIMSKLHEMKVKHRGMSIAEKISCNCDLCKGLNVNKRHRKIEMPTQEIKVPPEIVT